MNENTVVSNHPLCPQCGAKLLAGQANCWLCGAGQGAREQTSAEIPVRVIESSASRLEHTEKEVSRTHIVVLLVSVLVMGGLYRITPLLGVIGTAAFLPLVIRTVVGFLQGKPVSRQTLLKDFSGGLKAVVITIGVLGLVVACAFIAFLVVCAQILKGVH